MKNRCTVIKAMPFSRISLSSEYHKGATALGRFMDYRYEGIVLVNVEYVTDQILHRVYRDDDQTQMEPDERNLRTPTTKR